MGQRKGNKMLGTEGSSRRRSRFLPFLSLVAGLLVLFMIAGSSWAGAQDYLQVYTLGVGYQDTLLFASPTSSFGYGFEGVDPYFHLWGLGGPYSPVTAAPSVGTDLPLSRLYGLPGCLYDDLWLP